MITIIFPFHHGVSLFTRDFQWGHLKPLSLMNCLSNYLPIYYANYNS